MPEVVAPPRRTLVPTLCGIVLGAIVMAPLIFAAIVSAGAGHGHYVAARALFPFSLLLTLVEGSIGPVAMGVGLLQFPFYGAVVGWALAARRPRACLILAAAHLTAVLACFSGLLPGFS